MLMFLSIFFTGLLAVVLCAAIVSASQQQEQAGSESRVAEEKGKFFGTEAGASTHETVIPVDMLVSHIERHVRLEQAAAEGFIEVPTVESLRSTTASPFVN
jgi:hypothetical protein